MASEDWYRTYFGPDYLRVYRFADTAEQLAMLARFTAPLARGAKLLDLPCGQGRHAVELAGWGLAVTGLDLNGDLLRVAAAAAAERGVSVCLVRGDMRAFPFADEAFEACICLFTSLGYFDDDAEHQRVLDEFARVTRTGGRLLLDLANIDQVRCQPSASEWTNAGVTVRSEYLWDEATKRSTTLRWATFEDGRRAYFESRVRLFEGAEIEAMLAQAGWRVEDVWGGYDGRPLGPDTRRRILFCRREAGRGAR